jgi:hypothetical protein
MPDGINAAMDPEQLPVAEPSLNRATTHAQLEQLSLCNVPALSAGELGDLPISFRKTSRTCFSERRHLQ